MTYDVVIVGGRCAGAATAALLQREGVRTLVVEAAPRHADMPLSTHFMQPPGMDVLDDMGVGDKVRALTPPTRLSRYRMGDQDVDGPYPEGRPAYCVRRATLDPLLQNAAEEAGADVRFRHRVTDLLSDGERVSGVVVEGPHGREHIRAGLVVGADGRASTVARLTGVEEYLVRHPQRAGYWFYFPTPGLWRSDRRYRGFDAAIAWEGDGLRYLFQCDGDVLLMAAAPPAQEARAWGRDYRARTLDYLRRSDLFAPLLAETAPVGKGGGFLGAPSYFRRAVGPGFALVGDAGHAKDFVTGHGMSDAFLGARRLVEAVLQDTPLAYERYWRGRDAATVAYHFDAVHQGRVDLNDAFTRAIFGYVRASPDLSRRFGQVLDRQRHPFNLLDARETLGIIAKGVLRGRLLPVVGMVRNAITLRGYWKQEQVVKARFRDVQDRAAAASFESRPNQALPTPG